MRNEYCSRTSVFYIDREFKKKLEERANRMGLTAVQLRVLGELSRLGHGD